MDLQHEERLTKVEERSKSNTHRLEDLEKRQDNLENLARGMAAIEVKMERQETDIAEIKADVKTIAAKPGKKWDSLSEKVAWAIIAAVIGFVLASIGLA